MKSCATALTVLLVALPCSAQSDDADTWAKEWECFEKAEEVEDIDDLDKECAAIIEKEIEKLDRMEQEAKERTKKFKLYNGCLPMELIVEDLSEDGKEIEMSKEAIQNALESRLRAAYLYSTPKNFLETFKRGQLLFPGESFSTRLYARVSVVGKKAFSIDLQYQKRLADGMSGVKSYATTWQTGATGISSDAGYIMNALAKYMDEFLVEFLRVNEADCQSSRP